MSIKQKLLATFLFIFLILGGIQVYLVLQMNGYGTNMESIKEESLEKVLHAERMKLDVVQVQQWLTDISATRAAQGYDDGFEVAETYAADFYSTIENLKQLETNSTIQKLTDIQTAFDDYYEIGKQMANAYIEGGPELGNMLMDQFDNSSEAINESVNVYLDETIDALHANINGMHQSIEQNTLYSMIGMAIGLTITAILSYIITSSILKQLNRVKGSAELIANGDLTTAIDTRRRDEIGDLAKSFEHMRSQLSQLAVSIRSKSDLLTASSIDLESRAQRTEESSLQIAAAMTEIASGIEQQADQSNTILEAIRNTANRVEQGNTLADGTLEAAIRATRIAGEGKERLDHSIQAFEETVADLGRATANVQALGEKSKQIGGIIAFIQGISDQTNLLALNAAIEASRAGEHGKGFAIVADEVRKLAEETKEATSQISELILETQQGTQHAITLLEANQLRFDEQSELIHSSGDAMDNIVKQVNETEDNIQKLKAELNQINTNTMTVQKMIENSSAIIEETSASSEEISASTDELTDIIQVISSTIASLAVVANELNADIEQFKVEA